MRIGECVRLSPIGKSSYPEDPDNPHGVVGVVIACQEDGDPYDFNVEVQWDEDHSNDYCPEDLEPTITPAPWLRNS